MPELVVITGPIGSGKSTVADRLAEYLRSTGRSAVAVDLDDVVGMLRPPLDQLERAWQQARKAHGEIVAAWLRADVDVVIAHGPFYTHEETAALVDPLPQTLSPRWVMLLAPYEVALARVAGDDRRGVSRDPVFLRSTHERFQQLLPRMRPCEWTIDTTAMTPDAIVHTLASELLPGSVDVDSV
jgi:thymidylate kinase